MKVEITSERENPLVGRKEVTFRVEYKGATPQFGDVRKELIDALKSDGKLTVVDSVKSEFGRTVASGYAKVYTDAKSMGVEPKHRLRKNFEGKKKKEGQPAGETEAKPQEEAKAEKKDKAKPDTEEKPKEKAKESKPDKVEEAGEKKEG